MRESGVTPGLAGDTDKATRTDVTARYGEAERATSKLVDPAATSVAYDGTVDEVLVESVGERPVVSFRYSVAEERSVEEYAERVVAEHAVPETAFTESERAVLAEVTESGGYPVTDDEAAQSLLETLGGLPQAEIPPRGTDPVATPTARYPWRESNWLVRFRERNYVLKHFEKTSD